MVLTKAWQMKDRPLFKEAVVAVLSNGDPLGYSADEVAETLGLPVDGAMVQRDLEDMVAEGLLDRRGVGRGALYTLLKPLPLVKTPATKTQGLTDMGLKVG